MSTNSVATPIQYSKKKRTAVAVTLFACLVGTGGVSSAEYFAQREERGYRFDSLIPLKPIARALNVESFAQQLNLLRSALPVSVTTLADIFGVSRQTIYDWQNGATAAQLYQEKLRDLMRGTNALAESGIAISGHMLKRPISNGRSLLDAWRSGVAGMEAVSELAKLVLREREQQQTLSDRLKGRLTQTDPADFGSPSYSEHG